MRVCHALQQSPSCSKLARYHFLISTRRWVVPLSAANHVSPLQGLAAAPGHSAVGNSAALRRASTTTWATEGPGGRTEGASTAPDSSSEGPDLVQWVLSRGGKVQGVTLANLAGRDGGSGWGLKASQEVDAGHKLIELPASCQLTYSAESTDPKLLALIDQVPNELWGAKLALQLLAQRVAGPDSMFATYVAMLPRGFDGVPMFFGKAGIDAIEYAPVSFQVKKRCKWLYDFSQVLAKLPGTPADPFSGAVMDINALGWSLAAVSSRAFRTRGPSHPASMLPLIDMCNHSFTPNCEVLPTTSGALGLFAKRKLEAGEPLLISYGNLSNDFLFMDYGFIIADNPHDKVQLRFDIGLLQAGAMVANVTDSLGAPLDLKPTPWKTKLLVGLGLEGPGANTELNIGGVYPHLDPRVIAAARVMVAGDEAEVAGRPLDRLGDLDRPLSKDNERAALRTLSGVCAVALSRFTTSLEDDVALLEGRQPQPVAAGAGADASAAAATAPGPLTDDLRLSIRFRAEKKRILSLTIQALGRQLAKAQASSELKDKAGASKKGTKPAPATAKGFGAKPAK